MFFFLTVLSGCNVKSKFQLEESVYFCLKLLKLEGTIFQQDITGIRPLFVSLLPLYRFATMFVVVSDFKISNRIISSIAFS